MKRLLVSVSTCVVLLLLAAITPLASAKAPPLEPPDPARGIIGVKVKVFPPAQTGWSAAEVVYFVRIEKDSDRFAASSVIRSNFIKGGHIYLLNALPGRYAVVGCEFVLGTAGDVGRAAFSQADILRSEADVAAGGVVYMGAIEAESSTKIQEADPAQAHYLSVIGSTAPGTRGVSGTFDYTAAITNLVRDPAAARAFWNRAISKHFKREPAWSNGIAARSLTPGGVTAGLTPAAASSDRFMSTVCVDINTAKARESGQPQEAAKIARLICESILTDWGAAGCRENPDQAPCRTRLTSFDGSLKSTGSSMLYAAAAAGEASICSVMLDMGSDPNAAIATGKTPLMIAAESGHPDIVEMMTKAKAPAP